MVNDGLTNNEDISGDLSVDGNRANIHGQTDSQVFKEFEMEDREAVSKSMKGIENVRESNNLHQIDAHGKSQDIPKGALQRRLENEMLKSQDLTDKSPSAILRESNNKVPQAMADDLSTYKSVPNHFSLVSKEASDHN